MKRRLKSFFKLSLVFITLGTIMMLVGFLFGGAEELGSEVSEVAGMVRNKVENAIERIPMLERFDNINGFTVEVDMDEEDISVKINEEYETICGDYSDLQLADAGEVENLDISILNGWCKILPSENGYFGIKSTEANPYQCYVSEGTLYLSAFPKETEQGEKSEIILYVPETCEYEKVLLFCSGERVMVESPIKGKSMDVSSVSGVTNICGMVDAAKVTITAGIGKITLSSLVTEQLKLEVGTAEVMLDDVSAEDIEVNLGTGRIYAEGNTTGDIALNCGMGNLELLLNDERDSYNYDISGSAQSIRIGTDTFTGMVTERWIDNGAEKKITMNCAMGNIIIEFEKEE